MSESVLSLKGIKKWFFLKKGFLQTLLGKQECVHAVDGVSLEVGREEILGVAGESGCGKTTLGKVALKIIEPTTGRIYFERQDITSLSRGKMKKIRYKLQMIFQNPYESLNPKSTVYDIVAAPLRVQHIGSDVERLEKVAKMLDQVGLFPPENFFYRYPHELSGGQRQRVAISRAFVSEPKFVVADEPVSMLDVSIRAEVLNVMFRLVKRYGTSVLYITHDLALARHVCQHLAIMYLGKIVERGPTENVIAKHLHPYTEALIAAVPEPDPTSPEIEVLVKGEVPNAVNLPSGCRFHTRCLYAKPICRQKEPELLEIEPEHFVACHIRGD